MKHSLALLAALLMAALPMAAGQVPQPPGPKPDPGPKPARKPELPELPQPELPKGRPELPQKPTLTVAAPFGVRAATPAKLVLRPGKEAALSLAGSALGDVAELRLTRGGKGEPGVRIVHAAEDGGTLLSVRIAVPKEAADGAVALELRRRSSAPGAFQPVAGVALSIARPVAPPKKGAPSGKGGGASGSAPIEMVKVPVRAERSVPRQLELEKLLGLDVTDVRPARRAALGGGFEIVGSGLSKASAVKLGARELELVTRSDTRIVGRFPGGVEPITGALGVVIGKTLVPIVLDYEAVDAFAQLTPKVSLRHAPSPLQGPPQRADERPYDRANYILGFVVEQLPGTECTMTLASYRDGGDGGSSSAVVAKDRKPEFGEIAVNLNGALLGARPQLTVSARDPAIGLQKSFTLELPIDLAPRDTVTIDDTWSLRDALGFEQTWAWGTTNGTSDFGAGKVEVGVVQVGDDLAFRIASGPTGTEAVWRSPLSKLRNGWTVESMEWSETCVAPSGQAPKARALTVSRAVADNAVFDVGEALPGNFMRDAGIPDAYAVLLDHTFRSIPIMLRPHGAAASDAFTWTRPMVFLDYDERTSGNRPIYGLESSNWLRSMTVALKAEATVLNDHRVTVRLERVTFKRPPGEPLGPLFAQVLTHDREQIELVPVLRVR